jgi:hypothetical protein
MREINCIYIYIYMYKYKAKVEISKLATNVYNYYKERKVMC